MSRRRKLVLIGFLVFFILTELLYLWATIQPSAPAVPERPPGTGTSPVAAGTGLTEEGDGSGDGSAQATDSSKSVGLASRSPAAAEDPGRDEIFRRLLSEPPPRDLTDLAPRMGRVAAAAGSRATPAAPGTRRVGDGETFWLHDINSEQYFTLTAKLESIAPNAYLWVQRDLPFDRAALDRGAAGFSDEVYPKVRAVFGEEWSPGMDGDPKLHILHHEPIAGIAGYFYSADEYAADIDPHSNQREMFYVNLDSTTPGSYDYLALLAHEFQHMIHWNHDRDEAAWVNEGLSELAPRVAGYPAQSGSNFMSLPDTPLLEWDHEPGANAAHYAAAYAFFAYLRQRYGDAVIRAIVDAPANGAAGIESALSEVGDPQPFAQIFEDWVVANVAHSAAGGASGRRYGYGDLQIATAQVDPLPEGEFQDTVGQFGTDYYDVTGRVRDGRLRLDFAGDPAVGLLEPVGAREGAVWWSNRGDNMDARLTRTFDLSGVEQAALSFRLWHDLEENWDYAYFLASTDGGETWERVASSRTTDGNPNGNNFGGGLTGSSGSWVGETLDLTPYAGRPVTLRFEVVTDDAVNQSGVAIDDIRLDAAGFSDDAEADAGWQAEGWLRVDPELPQRWGLVAIAVSPSQGVTVHPIAVQADGSAAIDIAGIPAYATVTLAVSGLTPATRNVAGYRIGD